MKILGLDPATCTGWSVIEDGKILSFGTIQCASGFTLFQKLNFLHNEVSKLIDIHCPDYMAIEDVILAISGAKTLVYLARLNGICIQAAYSKLKDNVYLYEPNTWKIRSIPGIDTKSPKWKTQLEVCRNFNINVELDYEAYDKLISEKEKLIQDKSENVVEIKKEINKLKSQLSRKRNPLSLVEKNENMNKIKILDSQHSKTKIDLIKLKKMVEKELSSIGNDIYCQTGISSDVADSVGIGVCLYNELLT